MSRLWRFVRHRHHVLLAYLWLLLAAPSMTWWANSVAFVILLSLYANYESSMAADEAKQDREMMREMNTKVDRLIDFLGVDRVVGRDK